MSQDPSQLISELLTKRGLNHHGFSALEKPLSIEFYKNWLSEGLHGEMNYLKEHLPYKEDPSLLSKESKWAIVIAMNYLPFPENSKTKGPFSENRTAFYSKGQDYHFFFKEQLEDVCKELRTVFSEESFIPFTDSSPILERDLAFRAGLGWFGKNTCLIDQKKGSLFFIGEILTSLDLKRLRPLQPDLCGTCNRCIEACPTDAIIAPRKLDAKKCISYLTIESKNLPAENLRHGMGDWLFGCDICQSVCPWNEKALGKEVLSDHTSRVLNKNPSRKLIEELKAILDSSSKSLERLSFGTPFSRPRGPGLKRNALVVIANLRIKELTPSVSSYLNHPKLGPLALWVLTTLNQNDK